MKWLGSAAILLVSLGQLPSSVVAQDQPASFIFAEYYRCDQNRQAFADILVEHVFGPDYQKHVDEGRLNGWGWLEHRVGGSWRRVLFYAANDLKTLLETRDMIYEERQSEKAAESREFTSICHDHDDLVWETLEGTPVSEQLRNTGAMSYSTYYVCDVSRQERADEIVEKLFAPAIDNQVKAGKVQSWAWHAHVIGNRFRRLMTHSGASHVDLIEAVNAYNEEAGQANEAMATEFSEICNGHVDYLWRRLLPKSSGN